MIFNYISLVARLKRIVPLFLSSEFRMQEIYLSLEQAVAVGFETVADLICSWLADFALSS